MICVGKIEIENRDGTTLGSISHEEVGRDLSKKGKKKVKSTPVEVFLMLKKTKTPAN